MTHINYEDGKLSLSDLADLPKPQDQVEHFLTMQEGCNNLNTESSDSTISKRRTTVKKPGYILKNKMSEIEIGCHPVD